MLESLTFVTGNPGKAEQLGHFLDFPVRYKNLDLIEIQSLDLEAIIEYKAREAYMHVQSPVLVEDASLQLLALGKLPGPFIKWFFTELGTDGLCELLDEAMDRAALATVQFGMYDGQSFRLFTGTKEGSIALSPRGKNGFGWDSVFIPTGYHQTWAEMDTNEARVTSMRIIALKKLEAYLKAR